MLMRYTSIDLDLNFPYDVYITVERKNTFFFLYLVNYFHWKI